jgi:hypothetical protein
MPTVQEAYASPMTLRFFNPTLPTPEDGHIFKKLKHTGKSKFNF